MTAMKTRKGIIYTLFAMAFLLSLSIFVMVQGDDYRGSIISEKIRSDEIGYFVTGMQDDMGRGTLISGRKAVLSLVNNETDSGLFAASANTSIAELMQNGSLNGTGLDIMRNSTLSAWMLALKKIANGWGFDVNISTGDFNVFSSSAFGITAAGNTTFISYDPLTRVKYNRTFHLRQEISVEDLEDPYITIRSFAARRNTVRQCDKDDGAAPSGQWAYGRAYISTGNDCSFVPLRSSKILITDTMAGKAANCYEFKANVTADDSASGTAYLRNATRAYSAAKNDTYVVLSNSTLWMTNATSCYFEAPDGPSFLDRLEGRGTLSSKYNTPGTIKGIGAFLYVPPEYVLDYLYYG